MHPDAYFEVRFKTPSEGGRATVVSGLSDFYSCPMFVDGKAFDCRLMIRGAKLELGEYYRLPVKFLCPKEACQHLAVGKMVTLWEGKEIAVAKVLELVPDPLPRRS